MDIFGRCNGPGSSGGGGGGATGNNTSSTVRSISAAADSATVNTSETVDNTGTTSRMQLTGASAPGTAASPESGVSPLTDAYTKMTTDILTERTLGDFHGEHHPGELVKTGK